MRTKVIKLLLKLGNEVPEGKYLIKGSSFIHLGCDSSSSNDSSSNNIPSSPTPIPTPNPPTICSEENY